MLEYRIIENLLRSLQVKRCLFFLQNRLHLKPRSFCIVVACARSGSTALGNWLSNQPNVVYSHQTRILPIIFRYIKNIDCYENLHRSRDRNLLIKLGRELVWQYYTNKWFLWNRILVDKENFDPTVFPDGKFECFLSIVQELFPNIKIIYLVREPVSTIWSMQKKKWWGYSLTQRPLFQLTLEECTKVWNDSAMLASKYRGNKNVYICKFEDLVAHPQKESEKILQHLKIHSNNSFSPKKTSAIGFDQKQRQFILDATKEARNALYNDDFIDL